MPGYSGRPTHTCPITWMKIGRCATEAMESVRESLSHLRPIRLEPVFVAARVADAIQFTKLPSGIEVRVEKLDCLPVVMGGERTLTLVFTKPAGKCAGCTMDGNGLIVIGGSAEERLGRKLRSATMARASRRACMTYLRIELFRERRHPTQQIGIRACGGSRPLIDAPGGSVSVESDGVQGTTFHLPPAPAVEKLIYWDNSDDKSYYSHPGHRR